jgi:hypothetical protein
VPEKYKGYTDPDLHLNAFCSYMGLHAASDATKCKLFPTTLEGYSLRWFFFHPKKSIQIFQDLINKFMNDFA